MDLSPENLEHLMRGILWFTGTAIGAYLCFKEYVKDSRLVSDPDRHHPKLLLALGFICVLGAAFNIFVILIALSHIF